MSAQVLKASQMLMQVHVTWNTYFQMLFWFPHQIWFLSSVWRSMRTLLVRDVDCYLQLPSRNAKKCTTKTKWQWKKPKWNTPKLSLHRMILRHFLLNCFPALFVTSPSSFCTSTLLIKIGFGKGSLLGHWIAGVPPQKKTWRLM